MNEGEKILYHYTSLEGLLGIIESKSIWATNVLYLNDASELNYSIELLKKELLIYQKKVIGKVANPEYWFFGALIENIDILINSDKFAFFVCSFSEEEDLLSQWRGYCPDGIGFNVGIKFSGLAKSAQQHGFSLKPCIYDEKEQISQLKQLIQNTSFRYNEEIGLDFEEWDFKAKQLATDSLLEFIKLAPAFKHPKFKEENEWRIIANLQVKKVYKLIEYRLGKSMIVPYIEIFLPTEEDNLIINKVVVGPTHEPKLSKASVEMLLKSKNVKFDEVAYSTIPYRNW